MSFFAKNLRYLRSANKMSQTEFAKELGLTRSAIGAYEEQRSEPKIDIIVSMANFFNITIDDFLKKDISIDGVDCQVAEQKANENKICLQKIIAQLQTLEQNL